MKYGYIVKSVLMTVVLMVNMVLNTYLLFLATKTYSHVTGTIGFLVDSFVIYGMSLVYFERGEARHDTK